RFLPLAIPLFPEMVALSGDRVPTLDQGLVGLRGGHAGRCGAKLQEIGFECLDLGPGRANFLVSSPASPTRVGRGPGAKDMATVLALDAVADMFRPDAEIRAMTVGTGNANVNVHVLLC